MINVKMSDADIDHATTCSGIMIKFPHSALGYDEKSYSQGMHEIRRRGKLDCSSGALGEALSEDFA